jgi:hypothetical protein
LLLAQTRLPSGASSGHPAVRHRRRARPCQDASHGVDRRSASRRPIRFRRPGLAVRPSGRLVSGPVRCPVARVCRPGSGVQPSGVRPVRPDASSGPHQAVAFGDRPMRQGNPHHGNGSRSLVGAASSSGSGRRPSRPGRGRRRRGHAWSAGLSMADPGRVGCGRRPGLTLASWAGQAGVRSARRRRLLGGHGRRLPHRPRGCRPGAGWTTTLRGCRGASCPRERARRGRWACRRG